MTGVLGWALPQEWQIGIVLGLLVLAVVLFATERISVDVITLMLLCVLMLCGILKPAQAFAGFSDEIIIILASVFIISGALQETGVLDVLGEKLVRFASGSENKLLLALMTVASAISGLMNNTTVTAMFIPPVMGVARQAKISASRLLLPLAYASILGGTCTLIGTSTNVAVSGYINRVGNLEPLGLFEFTPIGLIIVVVGITYMMLIGKHLLPHRPDESLTDEYAIRDYLSEILVQADSPLIGQRVFESDLSKLDFRIIKVIRASKQFVPNTETFIRANDVLLVTGNLENLMKVQTTEGIEIRPEFTLRDQDLQTSEMTVAEILITPRSELIGRTLKETTFQQRYGMTALAINRLGRSLREKLATIRLRSGDVLLVQGSKERLEELRRRREVAVLEQRASTMYKKEKGLLTLAFFGVALVLGGFGIVPLSLAFLLAAVLALLFRCIPLERAYEFIDWRLLILIGGMIAFGTAMEETGAAHFLASQIVRVLAPMGVMPILAGLFVLTIVLTQPMSNAAAALVVLPIALNTARELGVNERTFAIGIMLAASISFVAPLEPSCVLVYGPGKYRFRDFLRTGAVLTLLLSALVLLLIPVFWPLRPA